MPPSSSGLGHHPFKVTARVRIPLGVPGQFIGPVVKLEFTPACQAGGRGFESRRDRQGRVAQSAERPPEKRKVTGSTPVSTTRKPQVRSHFRVVRAWGSVVIRRPSGVHPARRFARPRPTGPAERRA